MCGSCSEGITRVIVFVANFAFLLVGGALLALGILYTINYSQYTDAIPVDYQVVQHIPTVSIAVGSIIFFIAFLGCFGTLRSSTCMLITYAAILIVIFLAQVGLGVFALWKVKDSDDMQMQIEKHLGTLFGKYNDNNETAQVVNLIQQQFECCGVTGPSWWKKADLAIPRSCYADNVTTTTYTTGCSNALFSYFFDSIRLIGIVALTISLIEVLSAVLALCLVNCIRTNKRTQDYYT